MPVTKSAKKKMKQDIVRTERNQSVRTKLKSFMKKVIVLSKTDKAEAKKLLPKAFSVIDTASKKNLIHKNNAARKKSRLAKLVEGEIAPKKESAPKKKKKA